jgi:hypothetical protein
VSYELEFADCCSTCEWSPWKGLKGKHKKTMLCEKVGLPVKDTMRCPKYQRDESRISKLMGGYRSALRQKYDVK